MNQEKTKHPVNRHPVIFGTKFGHERGPQGSNRDAALCDESHTLGAPFGLPPGPGEGPGRAQKSKNTGGGFNSGHGLETQATCVRVNQNRNLRKRVNSGHDLYFVDEKHFELPLETKFCVRVNENVKF